MATTWQSLIDEYTKRMVVIDRLAEGARLAPNATPVTLADGTTTTLGNQMQDRYNRMKLDLIIAIGEIKHLLNKQGQQ
jgi:hypothetical protein